MKKEWFFDRFCGEQVAVYAEDGAIVEVGAENEEGGSILGNIYKGKVANVIAGMRVAFVSCGLGRNCYLPLDEGAARFSSYDGTASAHDLSLKEGDEILVQVTKLPRGNKGAKVTCELSFVGKYLIFLPVTDFLGISRKIVDEKTRERLLKEADTLRGAGQGYIVRTAAQDATPKRLKAESDYLKKVYASVMETAKTAPVGTAVHKEYDLPVRAMRDYMDDSVDKIYVGDETLYKKMQSLITVHTGISPKKLVQYTGARSMLHEFGLADQIYMLADPEVPLPNGGSLVIDRTEAMTVVDVNTGKYLGDTDPESTVFETNLQAAREIARQVRLRDIGGIVVVDFIDMDEPEHCAAVEAELTAALLPDKSKCRVLPMSELCLITFTRKRTNKDFANFLLKPCTHCKRQGFVLSDKYLAMRLRSEIVNHFADGYNAVIIELNRGLMQRILAERYFREEVNGAWRDKRVYLIPHSTWHEEKYTVRGENATVLTLPDTAQILY
ncbi:MAG: Rne/Rng family ribonuclease [Clostridia bacterium]|nr:Rne/Rng family ribonuclease [Clostridia bacterium]